MAIMTTNRPAPRGPSRSASFQKMLELEKKYKLERLQNVTRPPSAHQRYPLSSSSSSLVQHQHYPSHQHQPLPAPQQEPIQEYQRQENPQIESTPKDQPSSSFTKEQNLLMLKAVRRSVALPSLSISIPPPPATTKEDSSSSKKKQENNSDDDDQAVKAEAGGKTVTFLAPDELAVDEDDQSICQSPTWEGYKEANKKKKEEKKQKRKEKEQAAKDAKLAKKRLTARLSKTAPSVPSSKEPSPAPQNRKLLRSTTEPLSMEYSQDGPGDAQHALARLTGQPYVPSGKRPPTKGTNSFVGGVKLASQSEETVKRLAEAREKAIERDNAAATDPTSVTPKAFAITPSTMANKLGRKKDKEMEKDNEKSKEHANRSQVTKHGLFRQSRSNSTTPSTTEDALPEPSRVTVAPHNMSTPTLLQHSPAVSAHDFSRGRPGSAGGNSYVRSSREQSSERAISGFREEYKVAGFFSRLRTGSHAPNQPQISSASECAARPVPITEEGHSAHTLNVPLPPPLVSSPALSDTTSRVSQRGQPFSQRLESSQAPGSPTFSFMSGMTSYFEHQPLTAQLVDSSPKNTSESAPKIPEVATTPTLISEFNEATKPSPAMMPGTSSSQSDSRTSERSSSSSFADSQGPSSPVSPATTPDTSRPQSQKGGISAHAKDVSPIKDDADSDTLPEALHAVPFDGDRMHDVAKSSDPNSKTFKDPEDSWSRSAIPIDIDQQSIMTSMSNLDLNDASAPKTSLQHRPPISSTSSNASSQFEDAQEPFVPAAEITSKPQENQLPTPGRDVSFLPPLKHQPLSGHAKGKGPSKVDSRIFPVISTPQGARSRSMSPAPSNTSRPDTLRSDDSGESSSGPASYLQEARKSTQAPPPITTLKAIHHAPPRSSGLRQSMTVQNKSGLPDKPMAKMFVECCNCKFFHDMPSRVYECMVNPDSFVEDKRLGVSGAITTMVKCPWCAHNMSKECCAGYMALVMLQQKLH